MALWADGRRGKNQREELSPSHPHRNNRCLVFFFIHFFLIITQPSNILHLEHFHATSVTWQESSCRMKHLPVTNKLQLQGFLLPSPLWQPVSICSSNLTCLLTHRRLCWIEQRNYVALSLCWLLRQPGWAHSVLHCQSTLMSQLVPAPTEIWQRLEPTTAFDWLSR